MGKRVGQPIHSFTDKTVSSDFSLSVYLSICLSNSLSVCLAAFLSACPPVSISLCLSSVCQSVCQSVCLSVCLSVYQSVSQFVCLSVAICLSVYLSHYLSILVYSLVLSHFSFLLMHRPWLRCFEWPIIINQVCIHDCYLITYQYQVFPLPCQFESCSDKASCSRELFSAPLTFLLCKNNYNN